MQRTDRVISHAPFHPYARPSSRSPPAPNACTPTRVTRRRVYYTAPCTPSSRKPAASQSTALTPSFAAQTLSPTRVTRSSALKRTESQIIPPLSLKRAPSYSSATETQKSDDKPKRKRAKATAAPTPKATPPANKLKRLPSFLGEELPQPPVEPKPELQPLRRTLRRVGLASFSASPSPLISPVTPPQLKRKETRGTLQRVVAPALAIGRRISFGPGMGSGSGDGLQSPFEEAMRF